MLCVKHTDWYVIAKLNRAIRDHIPQALNYMQGCKQKFFQEGGGEGQTQYHGEGAGGGKFLSPSSLLYPTLNYYAGIYKSSADNLLKS